jgi:hypothetical protein
MLTGTSLRLRAVQLPASAKSPSPSASTMNEPHDQQKDQRADRGVDDLRNNSRAKVDAKLRQQPTAEEGAYDSDAEIADDPKSDASHDLAC